MKVFYMTDPNQPDLLVALQKMMPGAAGSLVAILLVQRPQNWQELVAAVCGGTMMAYFVGPFAASRMGWDTPEGISAMGFGTGMCAVILMPALMRRIQHLIGRWEGTWPPKFDPPDPPEAD